MSSVVRIRDRSPLTYFFSPASVAVVGASEAQIVRVLAYRAGRRAELDPPYTKNVFWPVGSWRRFDEH
jgi:hypothetical protein